MKSIKKIQNGILVLMAALIIIIAVYVVLIFIPNKKNSSVSKISETIKFDYYTYERDTKLYKSTFENLKDTLEGETIDYNKYAEYIAELFIIDFYTLDNKINKEDVGGLQYIISDMKENFLLNANNTVYKYLENNIDGNRNQELPIVDTIKLNNIESSTYKIGEKSYEAYKLNLEWTYKKDLGYDKSGIFTLIKDGEKLYIVEKS